MDAFEPEVGIATPALLEKLGCTVDYPFDQTCCGQPMTNTGCHKEAAGAEALFVKNSSGFDYVVAPSGIPAFARLAMRCSTRGPRRLPTSKAC